MTSYLDWTGSSTKKPWAPLEDGTPSLLDSLSSFSSQAPAQQSNFGFNMGDWGKGLNFGGAGIGGMASAAPGADHGLFSSFLPRKYADGTTGGGYGSAGLGILQGLGSAYMGMKQYGLAKDALKQSKEQFNLNYGAQQKMTNAQLSDRQTRRNADGYGMAADEYMKKYGV